MVNKKIENSDYQKIKEELEFYKNYVDRKKLEKLIKQKELAEDTLKKVLDLINSNEDLAHFYSTKQEIRQPIEEYFKKVKK